MVRGWTRLFALALLSCSGGGDSKDASPPDGGDDVRQDALPVSCRTSLDCRDAPRNASICDARTASCVECVTSVDCDMFDECVDSRCRVILLCENSLDCSSGLVCDADAGRCVECVTPADCPDDELCVGARCVPSCASDRTCTPLGLLCDRTLGHCVACLEDRDCAGGTCEAGSCEVRVDGVRPDGGSLPDAGDSNCPAEQKVCDGACVPSGPEVGCGTPACTACPSVENGTAVCAGADCDASCDAGFVKNGMTCLPPIPECSDGVAGPGETDVDCGGAACPKCPNGAVCEAASDCAVESCVANVCQVSRCTNGAFDPGETDVDCGGIDCSPCLAGAVCAEADDCESRVCMSMRCREPSCSDRVRNGLEVSTDCGGPDCGRCADGTSCREPVDCMSGICGDAVCRPTTCANGVKDASESDVDCGGLSPTVSCARCPTGAACTMLSDCKSSICTANQCQEPTCSDGVTNGTETGPDCGGDCARCPDNRPCRADEDCASGHCVSGTCRTACPGGALDTCAACPIVPFGPCCRTDGYCGCGIIGTCIL